MKGQPSVTLWGVYSVWRRHAQVYRNTWLVNSLPPLTEPVIYLVAFGYGLTPLVGTVDYQGETIRYLQFLAPGMMAVGVLFQSFVEGAFGCFIRLYFQRTWTALLTAPLSFSDVFVGDWLWATTKGAIAGTLTGLLAVALGLYGGWQLLVTLPIIVLGSLLFAGFGLLSAGLARTVDQLNVPLFLFLVPMFTLCGTYFPRTTLPPVLETIASVLPLAALADLLRWPLGLPAWWPLSLLWLVGWTVLLVVLSWRAIYPKLIR